MRTSAILLPFVLIYCCHLAARDIPQAAKPLVDEVHLLDADHARSVRSVCGALERATTAEIGVLIIQSTHGENQHAYALRVFNQWGIGKRGVNNGVLILFAMQDRRVEIVPGDAFKHHFTEAHCKALLERVVVPKMRAGQPQDAVVAGVDAVAAEVRIVGPEAKTDPPATTHEMQPVEAPSAAIAPPPDPEELARQEAFFQRYQLEIARRAEKAQNDAKDASWRALVLSAAWVLLVFVLLSSPLVFGKRLAPSWLIVLVLIAGPVLICLLVLYYWDVLTVGISSIWYLCVYTAGLISGFCIIDHDCPQCGKWMSVSNRTIRNSSYLSSGLGEKVCHCSYCLFHDVSTFTIPILVESTSSSYDSSSSSSSYDSGSSSFGGGSSGGGGGGASW